MAITRKRLLIIGAIVFGCGLLVSFPARVAYHLFAPEPLKLANVSGTLWSGSAAQGQVGNLHLGNIQWTLRPLALFAGKAALDTSFDPAGGFIESRVAVSLGGRVSFSDLSGAVSISAIQDLLPAPGIQGNARVEFSELALEDGLPVAADGTLDIVGLFVRGFANAPVGDYRAELTTTEDGVTGSVEDLSGMLDVAGALRINADRSYSLTGLVAPTTTAPQSVLNQLKFLGSANERGQHEFRFEGLIP